MLTRGLREFAQTPDRYTWVSADVERYADERVCVVQGSIWAVVSGVRAPHLSTLVDDVRRRVPSGKTLTWFIDPDAEPPDAFDQLVSLGFRTPTDGHGLLHALACTDAPAGGPPDVEVTRVETFDDHLAAYEVMWDAFATPLERREEQRPHLRAEFEAAEAAGVPVTFLARIEGAHVGVGRSVYSERGVFLIGGSVAEQARGRGVYRALVRARWDDAVARGTPALVTEAIHDTSYPILKSVGFVDVCEIRRLEDPTYP